MAAGPTGAPSHPMAEMHHRSMSRDGLQSEDDGCAAVCCCWDRGGSGYEPISMTRLCPPQNCGTLAAMAWWSAATRPRPLTLFFPGIRIRDAVMTSASLRLLSFWLAVLGTAMLVLGLPIGFLPSLIENKIFEMSLGGFVLLGVPVRGASVVFSLYYRDILMVFIAMVMMMLDISVGVMLIVLGDMGREVLTAALASWFIAKGIFEMCAGFCTGSSSMLCWARSVVLFSALFNLVLGTMALLLWPTSQEWYLGLLVGVYVTTNAIPLLLVCSSDIHVDKGDESAEDGRNHEQSMAAEAALSPV